jgi:hypothetical protein
MVCLFSWSSTILGALLRVFQVKGVQLTSCYARQQLVCFVSDTEFLVCNVCNSVTRFLPALNPLGLQPPWDTSDPPPKPRGAGFAKPGTLSASQVGENPTQPHGARQSHVVQIRHGP